MTPEQAFTLANAAVLPAWILLIAFPRWRWTALLVPVAFVVPLAGAYGVILALHIGGDGGFGTLAGVAQLFQNPWVLLGGWIHYLVFDLFIGAWELHDAQRIGLKHSAIVPALFLTFLLGPLGLLVYLTIRGTVRKQWSLREAP